MTDDDADRTPAPSTSIAWRLGHVIVGVLAVRGTGAPPPKRPAARTARVWTSLGRENACP